MYVNFNILNQLGSPSLNSNTFANRPAAGQVGRLFISTDTLAIYRDNGTSWDQIGGGSGISGSGTAGQVTYWDGTSSVTGESAFTYNASTNQLRVDGNISMANDAEAWGDLDALQIYNASFAGYLNNAYMSANAYYDGNDWIYIDSSTATWYSQTGATHTWARAASGTAGTTIGWITGMILDSNSRLGVNAAPSDWLSTYKNVQLPFGASFYSRDNGTTVGLTSNAYLNNVGAGSWTYFTTGTSARYEMANNTHAWYIAASGSGAITYTQAMTLFDTGDLALGQTTDAGFKLDVNGTARFSGSISVQNVAIGLGAGSISTNTRVGTTTLIVNTTGSLNTAIGNASLASNTTGSSNTGLGVNSLTSNTTASTNTAIGVGALAGITTGSNNTAIGVDAGRYRGGTSNPSNQSNSILIGYNTRVQNLSDTNSIVIGNSTNAIGSNTTVIGTSSTVTTWIQGNLLLGTNTDSGNKLRVNGTVRIDGQTAVLAGGSAGLHLIVNCDGTNYKIALLNV